jgi:hypothetical protein
MCIIIIYMIHFKYVDATRCMAKVFNTTFKCWEVWCGSFDHRYQQECCSVGVRVIESEGSLWMSRRATLAHEGCLTVLAVAGSATVCLTPTHHLTHSSDPLDSPDSCGPPCPPHSLTLSSFPNALSLLQCGCVCGARVQPPAAVTQQAADAVGQVHGERTAQL